MVLLDLRERHKEREEPNEAGAAIRERHSHIVQTVIDPGAHDRSGIKGRGVSGLGGINREPHLEVLVLRPIVEYLVGNRNGSGFHARRQLLILI